MAVSRGKARRQVAETLNRAVRDWQGSDPEPPEMRTEKATKATRHDIIDHRHCSNKSRPRASGSRYDFGHAVCCMNRAS